MKKLKHYSLKRIFTLAPDALYYVIIGERSNGKTFAVLEYGIQEYFKNGSQMGIIRRLETDIKGNNGEEYFKGLIHTRYNDNLVEIYSKGKWNDIKYYQRRWYFCKRNDLGEIEESDSQPFAFAFALTLEEHYKGLQFPLIRTILFDEFLTRNNYLIDEFIKFTNMLSTIIRLRTDVKIFMCGNTINQFCPYVKEMGLSNMRKMEKGKIDIYSYGTSGLKVAVEFSDFPSKDKKSNIYFAFNNPKLEMIKSGAWEISIYPHLIREDLIKSKVLYEFFIEYEEFILHCEIRNFKNDMFIYVHDKTTPIKEDNKNLVYNLEPNKKANYRCFISRPQSTLEKKIAILFSQKKIFYQNNMLGEVVRNYLQSN